MEGYALLLGAINSKDPNVAFNERRRELNMDKTINPLHRV